MHEGILSPCITNTTSGCANETLLTCCAQSPFQRDGEMAEMGANLAGSFHFSFLSLLFPLSAALLPPCSSTVENKIHYGNIYVTNLSSRQISCLRQKQCSMWWCLLIFFFFSSSSSSYPLPIFSCSLLLLLLLLFFLLHVKSHQFTDSILQAPQRQGEQKRLDTKK